AELLAGSGPAPAVPEGVRRALISLDRVAAGRRAPAYLALARLLSPVPDGAEALVEVLLRWASFGAAGECSPDPQSGRTQRGDLVAMERLREAAENPRAAAALCAAERASLAAGARTAGPAGDAPE